MPLRRRDPAPGVTLARTPAVWIPSSHGSAPDREEGAFAFWFAYIITRPLGASYADWLGVPKGLGGLDLGRGAVAIALTIVIIAWVAYLSISQVDVDRAS